jgi:16S rRNA (uracil1498-N3)-methyltransferase
MRIEVLVGPEGGFTVDEVGFAEQWGVQRVSLGPRTLRSETAGVVAAAAILYEAGDM